MFNRGSHAPGAPPQTEKHQEQVEGSLKEQGQTMLTHKHVNSLKKFWRHTLEFNGIIFSDDPQMKAISDHYDLKKTLELMINAGVDIFCFGNNLIYDPDIVKKVHMTIGQLLEEKSISEDQLRLSFQRIMNLKSMIGLV